MLSLSFEGNTLRLLEAQGKKVVRWHSSLFNTALVRRGAVADPAGLSQVLAKALETGGFKGRQVFASLDGTNSLSRIISVPRGASAKASDFIPREARRLWSINPDESLLYWQPVSAKKDQFFVLCLPREPVLALTDTLRMAGLQPVLADLRPLCLARALNQARAVALCAESNSVLIVVLIDHIPVLMQTHWLPEGPLSPEAIAGYASPLLGQALAYYNDTHSEEHLSPDTPLYVFGAAADEPLRERLHADTGYPLQQVSPVLSAPAEFPLGHFMVNLGLLMKAL